MNLDQYLTEIKPKMTAKRFAEHLGISHMHLCRLRRGKMFPSREIAMDIESLTHGAVTFMELMLPVGFSHVPKREKKRLKEEAEAQG